MKAPSIDIKMACFHLHKQVLLGEQRRAAIRRQGPHGELGARVVWADSRCSHNQTSPAASLPVSPLRDQITFTRKANIRAHKSPCD